MNKRRLNENVELTFVCIKEDQSENKRRLNENVELTICYTKM